MLTKDGFFKQTVTADERDKRKQENYVTERRYVYKAWIDDDNYADLSVVEESDIDTIDDGTRTTASEVLLTCQCNLKLMLECVVQTTNINYILIHFDLRSLLKNMNILHSFNAYFTLNLISFVQFHYNLIKIKS